MKTSLKKAELPDKEIIDGLLLRNEKITQYLFYEKCSNILSFIEKEVFNYHINKDELVSELYIYLQENNWDKIKKFNYQSNFTTWLSKVAFRYFQRRKMELIDSRLNNTTIEQIINFSTQERYDTFIHKMDLYEVINKLKSPRDKFVIMAIEVEGWGDQEVANMLGIKISNLYNIKSRALKTLSHFIR